MVDSADQKVKAYKIQFSGTAGEYFRIWIVNLFLTVITLGIYAAWAKVRTRRYFYAHTKIDGHAFDYLARPVNILIGHLIVGGLFIAYAVSGEFYPMWSFAFVLVFYLVLPFLIHKSAQFYTHNSAFRNIRFRFSGTLWQSYQLFLLLPLLIPLTLGLFWPYWEYCKKWWFFNHCAFGDTPNEFSGRAMPFYKIYLLAFLQFLIMAAIIAGIGALAAFLGLVPDPRQGMGAGAGAGMAFGIFAGMFILYLVMLVGTGLIRQFIFANVTNYCWSESRIGPVSVRSELSAGPLFWITTTNILAIILSLGLAIPWAKVRRTRYILSCLTVRTTGGLDDFTSAAGSDVTAVGDAATDFFDFDIGL